MAPAVDRRAFREEAICASQALAAPSEVGVAIGCGGKPLVGVVDIMLQLSQRRGWLVDGSGIPQPPHVHAARERPQRFLLWRGTGCSRIGAPSACTARTIHAFR